MRVGLNNQSLLYYDPKMEHFAIDDEDGSVKIIDGGDLYFYGKMGEAKRKIFKISSRDLS